MKKIYTENSDIPSFEKAVTALVGDNEVKGIIILSCISNSYPPEEVNKILETIDIPITGGFFLELIYEGQRIKTGSIIIGLTQECQQISIKNLVDIDLKSQISDAALKNDYNKKTIFVFMDALANNKDLLIENLYNTFGQESNYIGGGAASLAFEPFPCIYSNQGLLTGGASVIILDAPSTIGVAHGWQPISSTMKVTQSQGNEIISLDWRPAFEVYREIVESHSGQTFNTNEFFNSTKSYPFGISRLDSEMSILDPFKEENGSVFTLDSITEGSHICILYGDTPNLLQGAALAKSRSSVEEYNKYENMIINCISRVLFMEDDYEKELEILDPTNSSFGACTFGEVANSGDSFLEIYNKTAVVGKISTL